MRVTNQHSHLHFSHLIGSLGTWGGGVLLTLIYFLLAWMAPVDWFQGSGGSVGLFADGRKLVLVIQTDGSLGKLMFRDHITFLSPSVWVAWEEDWGNGEGRRWKERRDDKRSHHQTKLHKVRQTHTIHTTKHPHNTCESGRRGWGWGENHSGSIWWAVWRWEGPSILKLLLFLFFLWLLISFK